MNLDELRSVQSKERQKDSLQNLRPSFYQEVGEYIADLEEERDRAAERAEDPFSSPEVSRLTDEIETAKDVVEAIYERRMGKLVKQASLAAAGMAADDEGLTAEEADLFDDLVDRIESNKSRVLDVLEGEAEADPQPEPEPSTGDRSDSSAGPTGVEPGTAPERDLDSDPPTEVPPDAAPEPGLESESERADGADDAPPVPPQEPPAESEPEAGTGTGTGADRPDEPSSGVTAADVMGGDGPPIDDGPDSTADPEPPETGGPRGATDPADSDGENGDATGDRDTATRSDDVDRVTVRITQDVGSILGVDDREYTLSTDDVVTLPEQNATPLVDRDAAEPLE
ncbi:hypothetical protein CHINAEXTREME_11125 [Halobiforma lacisalsi AJ5]|uniref:Uncharacterized protein n=1 Tax=Natronobacterium lacisalsi AJ5 TaxID=358396 RepID=M0L2Z9_NATLA|nr:hypothetical protein [Halobiforma lacisalsi]APW98310.1 hypothetical protein CHINAEXTREME_11125 [Halobiforma lacisalsi AJ5]EMA27911.1 hypothetical protein C445_19702 [Halobiforma lacisalsi AJ5]